MSARGRGSALHTFRLASDRLVWKPFEAAGYPEERWPEIRASLEQLRPLSSQALMAIYQMTMSDEVDSAFGKQLERISKHKG